MIITHYPWCTWANPPRPQTLRPMAQRVQQAHLANTVLTCPFLQVCSWAALLPPIGKRDQKTHNEWPRRAGCVPWPCWDGSEDCVLGYSRHGHCLSMASSMGIAY